MTSVTERTSPSYKKQNQMFPSRIFCENAHALRRLGTAEGTKITSKQTKANLGNPYRARQSLGKHPEEELQQGKNCIFAKCIWETANEKADAYSLRLFSHEGSASPPFSIYWNISFTWRCQRRDAGLNCAQSRWFRRTGLYLIGIMDNEWWDIRSRVWRLGTLVMSPERCGANLNVTGEHRVTTQVDHRKGSWDNQEKGPESQQSSPPMSQTPGEISKWWHLNFMNHRLINPVKRRN